MTVCLSLASSAVLGLAPSGNSNDPGELLFLLPFLAAAAFLSLHAVAPGPADRRIKAGTRADPDGNPHAFTLALGGETVALEPGKPWVHADHYKWVTRGIIEEPQSFHVQRDGTVEINGEKIRLSDPDGPGKLELEINKRHALTKASPAPRAPGPAAAPGAGPGPAGAGAGPVKVRFKVKLDRLGHLMIECHHGGEKVETGPRGLGGLVQNGFMLRPGHVHLDPLQRGIEIDGVWFETSEAGARQLEEILNAKYALTLKADQEQGVEVRENAASPTGFDIHFVTIRVGARFDVKGHLSQDLLDILQNPAKCDLLKPGTVVRLSPPHLILRRKRPDGGEEHIPDIADLNYLRCTAAQLHQFLNHPLIRRKSGATGGPALPSPELPADRAVVAPPPVTPPPAEPTRAPSPASRPPPTSPLPEARSGPVQPTAPREPATASAASTTEPAIPPGAASTATAAIHPQAAATDSAPAPAPAVDHGQAVRAPFAQVDPIRANAEIFGRLVARFGIEVQDLLLSLPRVFSGRRFEIIRFSETEIDSVLDLRSEEFYGFYLSHISERRIDFVYACRGTHIEWGADKCVLQASAAAEAIEFPGAALLGMAQTRESQFVFIVTPAYRLWVRPQEPRCREAFAHFLTVDQFAADPDAYSLIWPEPEPTS